MVGAPVTKGAFTKAASIPTRQQSEDTGARLLDLLFAAVPSRIFSNF